jgi:hypothetical protein
LIVKRGRLANSLYDFAPEDKTGRYPVVQQVKTLTKQIAAMLSPPAIDSHLTKATLKAIPKNQLADSEGKPAGLLDTVRLRSNTSANISKWKKKMSTMKLSSDEHKRAAAKLEELNVTLAKCDLIIQQANG